MSSIVLPAVYGDQDRQVYISKPNGMASKIYHVVMDSYYQGVITLTSEGWRAYMNDRSEFCTTDIDVMLEAVEGIEGEEGVSCAHS